LSVCDTRGVHGPDADRFHGCSQLLGLLAVHVYFGPIAEADYEQICFYPISDVVDTVEIHEPLADLDEVHSFTPFQ
jgi:hypothetical protein